MCHPDAHAVELQAGELPMEGAEVVDHRRERPRPIVVAADRVEGERIRLEQASGDRGDDVATVVHDVDARVGEQLDGAGGDRAVIVGVCDDADVHAPPSSGGG